ncbi:MAG: Type I restriction-modification system, specificity subunit S [Burkholderiaceae bacterium]|jgi:type I restriction enzyme S subunit|nr:MAG: Type I restriction-modification system, specificity subunit S [Burkholderiaceae bacterium]
MSEDGRWELPASWCWTTTHQVASVVGGATPTNARDESNYSVDGIPWITPADLSGYKHAYIARGARNLSTQGFNSCSARLLPKGTVLLSSRAPVGYCAIAASDIATNQGFKSLVLHSAEISPEFVRHYLLGSKRYLESQASGTTFLELSGARTEQLLLPLAPAREQQCIVSRIEELFSEIDEGERALERVQKLVECYRQSVLKAAVTGELTREYRDTRSSSPGDREGDKYSLPPGWSWRSLDELSWATSYGTSAKCSSAEGATPVLRIPNVREGRIALRDLKWAPADFDMTAADALAPGDLLVVRTNGSESLIGVGAVVLSALPTPSYFASYLIRFRLHPQPLLAEWINLVWQSDVVRRFVHKHKATSAGQYNVSQSKLRSIRLPIPPESERAALLDASRLAASRMESALKECSAGVAGSAALRQTILKAAFSGQLVPQDPADEPASALLARLVAEAGEGQNGTRRRDRRVRTTTP